MIHMQPGRGDFASGRRRAVARLAFIALLFSALAGAIAGQHEKRLIDFDQSFYLTIAYDLVHHGTFSNGIFDHVDSTRAKPPPGMFFAPLYPLVVAAAAKIDARFAATLDCTIEANEQHRPLETCEIYARPLLVANAVFITAGVVAIAATAETIFAGAALFYLAALLAAVGIGSEADLLSFLMTESLAFGLFSLFGLALVRALARGRWRDWALAGLAAGIAALVRPPYLLMLPLALVLLAAAALCRPRGSFAEGARAGNSAAGLPVPQRADGAGRRLAAAVPPAAAFVVAAALVLTPWLARNVISLGKLGFTEEYGAATLVERLAFNSMTGQEFALAFPYCVPTLGPAVVNALAGEGTMARFTWNSPGSFFEQGRSRREALLAAHGRLDPIIGGLMRDEMARDWWRHIGTSIALSWCGLWVSGLWSVLLLPMFAVSLWQARRRVPLLWFYAAPALALVGVHGVLANHYPRYNLGLIGPIAVGAAWVIVRAWQWARERRSSALKPG